MKVIGAGYGRTGTLSLKAGLEQVLGGRCYHMETIVHDARQLDLWSAWARSPDDLPDLDAMLDGFVAAVDAPMCFYWEELLARHPDARVVLTVRDPDRWVESFQALMRANFQGIWMALFSSRYRAFAGFSRTMGQRFVGSLRRERLIETFHRHNERVRAVVPADRLLEFEVKQGWAPLCAFLDVPVPDGPFPHLNEGTATIRAHQRALAFGRPHPATAG